MMKDMLSSTPSTSIERLSPAVAVELNEQDVDTELPCVQETEVITRFSWQPRILPLNLKFTIQQRNVCGLFTIASFTW